MIGLKKRREKATGYSGDEDVVEGLTLEDGEEICSSCKGRGYHPSNQNPDTMASTCQKCEGAGKVDWITNAMGVPKRKYHGSGYSGFSSSYMYAGTSGFNGPMGTPGVFGPNGSNGSSGSQYKMTSSYAYAGTSGKPVSVQPGAICIDNTHNNNKIKVFDGNEWQEIP